MQCQRAELLSIAQTNAFQVKGSRVVRNGRPRETSKRSPVYLGPSQPQGSPRGGYWLGNLLYRRKATKLDRLEFGLVSAADSQGRTIFVANAHHLFDSFVSVLSFALSVSDGKVRFDACVGDCTSWFLQVVHHLRL